MFKKHVLAEAESPSSKAAAMAYRVPKGATVGAKRSVLSVREHGKMARTPLACLPQLWRRLTAFSTFPWWVQSIA